MKIKRTVKDSYLGIPLSEAGLTETIDEDRMDTIILGNGRLSYAKNHPHRNAQECWEWFKRVGKCETWYATYELLEA